MEPYHSEPLTISLCPNCDRSFTSGPLPPSFQQELRENDISGKDLGLGSIAELEEMKRQLLNESEQLKAVLSQIEDRQAIIQRHIEARSSLAAPIRKLPEEVLLEIFMRMYGAMGNDLAESFKSDANLHRHPFVISSVCKYWRTIATACPRLWTCISIRSKGSSPAEEGLVKIALARSESMPLYVSLTLENTIHNLRTDPRMKSLASHLHRIQFFRIVDCRDGGVPEEQDLSLELPLLNDFVYVGTVIAYPELNQPLPFLNHAPVRHIEFSNADSRDGQVVPHEMRAGVRSFVGKTVDLREGLALFALFPNVITAQITVERLAVSATEDVVLSHLRSLSWKGWVSTRPKDPAALMSHYFDRLVVPSLETLTIRGFMCLEATEPLQWSRDSFATMVSNSGINSKLTSLSIIRVAISADDLMSAMLLLPSLRRLFLEPETTDSTKATLTPSSLTCLIAKPDDPLVPSLTQLGISFLFDHEAKLRDDCLQTLEVIIEIVRSRTSLLENNPTARLRELDLRRPFDTSSPEQQNLLRILEGFRRDGLFFHGYTVTVESAN